MSPTPELNPYGADGVAECQARLSVPRSGIRRACAGEKITGPKRRGIGFELVDCSKLNC